MDRVFIATPMYGGMCHGAYAGALALVTSFFIPARVSVQFHFRTDCSLITRARDDLADEFMKSDCTHLMFIDSDIGFDPQDILTMLAANKDVILGAYPRKEIGAPLVVKTLDGAPFPAEGDRPSQRRWAPLEVAGGGMGFALIKRKVFVTLASKSPTYVNPRNGMPIKNLFPVVVEDGHLLGEDIYFCAQARNSGYKVWAAPWVKLTHTGSFQFG